MVTQVSLKNASRVKAEQRRAAQNALIAAKQKMSEKKNAGDYATSFDSGGGWNVRIDKKHLAKMRSKKAVETKALTK
jgi:hypothetical protein